MNTQDIERLRIACNQHYLEKYMDVPVMDDSEYDALVKEYEADGRSVKDLIEFEKGQKIRNNIPIGLNKVQVWDNQLGKAVENYLKSIGLVHTNLDFLANYYLNFKYDGGAILGKYRNGKLYQVVSTPDEEFGINRTSTFWDLFPHEIEDKTVIAIQGEALVDYRAYGQKARNKANGLLNSINMEEEAKNELFIRAYRVYFDGYDTFNYDRSRKVLMSLPVIRRTRMRRSEDGSLKEFDDAVFKIANPFMPLVCPSDALMHYADKDTDDYFQVDGVVLYTRENGIKGFKFYYTESAITTITHVVWSLQGNGGYSAKLQFNTVTLNDKNISQASSGGVPNLIANKMGKGAKVRVILSNMTIPKVIEVLEPSEDYEWPVCGCGYHFSEKDIFGSTLKCQSKECIQRYKQWEHRGEEWYKDENGEMLTGLDLIEKIKETKFKLLEVLLNIDRWAPYNSFIYNEIPIDKDDTPEEIQELKCINEQRRKDVNAFSFKFVKYISEDNLESFTDLIKHSFRFSDLSLKLVDANIGTAFRVMVDRFKNKILI